MGLLPLIESYKAEYRDRVYYANCCNYCFSFEKLLRCASCLMVYYCSKEHQGKDWKFHKATCKAIKEIKTRVSIPKTCDQAGFLEYTKTLLTNMMTIRGFDCDYYLTQYERQICLFPWVCSICYKKPSSKHVCEKCLSITYCSSAHKKMDTFHSAVCTSLRLCRIFASTNYENGFKFEEISSKYYPIKKKLMRWPENKMELGKLIQKKVKTLDSDEDIVALSKFVDPYMPAATIINALERIGSIRKRHFITKCLKKKSGKPKKKRTSSQSSDDLSENARLTIHFPFADEYELSFQWDSIAILLTDWIENIDDVEVVLTGPMLKDCKVPSYEGCTKLAGITVHDIPYQDVDFPSAPDLIVVLECHRSLYFETDFKYLDSLFKYSNVPVISASGEYGLIDQITSLMNEIRGVQILEDLFNNEFTDFRMQRDWKCNIAPYKRNHYFTVHKKC